MNLKRQIIGLLKSERIFFFVMILMSLLFMKDAAKAQNPLKIQLEVIGQDYCRNNSEILVFNRNTKQYLRQRQKEI